MPKVSLICLQLKEDLELHVGDNGKFVSLADAIRTACRKLFRSIRRYRCTCMVGGEYKMPTRHDAEEAVRTLLSYLEGEESSQERDC